MNIVSKHLKLSRHISFIFSLSFFQILSFNLYAEVFYTKKFYVRSESDNRSYVVVHEYRHFFSFPVWGLYSVDDSFNDECFVSQLKNATESDDLSSVRVEFLNGTSEDFPIVMAYMQPLFREFQFLAKTTALFLCLIYHHTNGYRF